MKINKKIYSIITLLIFFLTIIPTYVYARKTNESITLSKEECINIALKNSTDLKKINSGFNTLNRKLDKAKELSDTMDKALKALDKYKILYSKEKRLLNNPPEHYSEYMNICTQIFKISQNKELSKKEKNKQINELQKNLLELNIPQEEMAKLFTPKEVGELLTYKLMFKEKFGITNPYINDKEKFEKFIKPRDFIWYAIEGEIKKLKFTKGRAENSIRFGVIQLYDGIVQLNDVIKIKENLYNVQNKQFKQLSAKFKYGQASKLEKDIGENELKKLKLDLDNFKRTRDNLEMSLKKLLKLPLNKKLNLNSTVDDQLGRPLEQKVYVRRALESRSEINSCKIDIDVKTRELNIIKKYLTSNDLEWKETEKTVKEKQTSLTKAKIEVEKSIKTSYVDLNSKKSNINLASKKITDANKKLNTANKTYECGLTPLYTLWNAELNKSKCEIEYKKAKIEYNEVLYGLKLNTKLGYDTQK